jgi:YVTN family beta-propeller protein
MRTPVCAAIALWTLWSAAGCTASAEDVRPPPDQLVFPTGIAVSPDEKSLFVVNANSELRYDSGSVGVIDLATVQGVIDGWTSGSASVPSGCSQDTDHSETLICEESQFFRGNAGVRLGNFATGIAMQDFSGGGATNLRLFVPTRGDPSVAWADFDGTNLHCNAGPDTYALCDDAHRLTSLHNDPDLVALPGEPFGVFADATDGFAMVTHLVTGAVTLIKSQAGNSDVEIVDIINRIFAQDLITGLSGATSIAGRRTPGQPGDVIYVGSNTENRIQTFTVAARDSAASYLLPSKFFFLDAVGTGAGNSSDTRGMQFSADGNRLYVVNRLPPSLAVYDTSLGPTGAPLNIPQGASDICREASSTSVLDPGVGERVYVTCFLDGQLYVIDPTGQTQVEDIISVGRGPYAAAVVTGKNTGGKKQLFVSNFLEDTIAVIDLTIDSPRRNRVVLRIGTPRAP